jgi:hypothetical protein
MNGHLQCKTECPLSPKGLRGEKPADLPIVQSAKFENHRPIVKSRRPFAFLNFARTVLLSSNVTQERAVKECPVGHKRTFRVAIGMSAFEPKRTFHSVAWAKNRRSEAEAPTFG